MIITVFIYYLVIQAIIYKLYTNIDVLLINII